MRTLDKIVLGIAGIAMGLTSCASVQQYPELQKKKGYEYSITQINLSSFSDIEIITKDVERGSEIKRLLDKTRSLRDYAEFKSKYGTADNEIIDKLKDNKLEQADELVRKLARKLDKDNNPYAQTYMQKVKDFTYTIRVYYDAAAGKKTEVVAIPWNEQIADGIELILSPLNLLVNQSFGRYNFIEEKEVKLKFFDEIVVNPFSGARKVVRLEVPVEGPEEPRYQQAHQSIVHKEQSKREAARKTEIASRSIGDIKEIAAKYRSEFRKIRRQTNPDSWGAVCDSHRKKKVVVDDSDISRSIHSLYNRQLEEGNHPLYDPLRTEIRNFAYYNITIEISTNLLKTLSYKRANYEKSVTEFYEYNPYYGTKNNLNWFFAKQVGKHPCLIIRRQHSLGDLFTRYKKEHGK